MEVLIERCAGLDVHKDTVQACVRVPGPGGRETHQHEFGTTTRELLALSDWLSAYGVTLVGMESTGVYWKPVYYVLEDAIECHLLNARHLRNVPGRKTDVADAAWICQLVEHGLVRPSFVPPQPIRELRNLTRYRKTQIEERTREAQRLDKILQDAGVKLSSIASDICGVSGRAILAAMVEGTREPEVLAELAKGTLRRKIPALREALEGRFGHHHALIVSAILAHLEFLEESIDRLSDEISEVITPFGLAVEMLRTVPGVDRRTAEVLVAEIGVDMDRFGSAERLASWAGLCPGNNESAGKHYSGRTRKGSKWLRTALVQSAKAAARSKDTYFAAQYARLKGRRGHGRATVAVAHSLLVVVYHVLDRGVPYAEIGADYFVRRHDPARQATKLVRQLTTLGYRVTLDPVEGA